MSDQPRKIMVEIDDLQELLDADYEGASKELIDKYQPAIDAARKAR